MLDDQQIADLCLRHGAKVCSDAAYRAMEGRRSDALRLGFGEATLPALYAITTLAYRLMTDAQRACDLADAAISGARISAAS